MQSLGFDCGCKGKFGSFNLLVYVLFGIESLSSASFGWLWWGIRGEVWILQTVLILGKNGELFEPEFWWSEVKELV